jgi:hypothetical protein
LEMESLSRLVETLAAINLAGILSASMALSSSLCRCKHSSGGTRSQNLYSVENNLNYRQEKTHSFGNSF